MFINSLTLNEKNREKNALYTAKEYFFQWLNSNRLLDATVANGALFLNYANVTSILRELKQQEKAFRLLALKHFVQDDYTRFK